jgi:cytochrome P450
VLAAAMHYIGRDKVVLDYVLVNHEHALNAAKEALRMHPGAPMYDRGMAKGADVKMACGHHLRAGSRPLVCPHIIGTDPVYWPDPMTFDPKRFEGHEGFQSKGFVPFGYAPEEGGRACTGRYYALEVLPWLITTIFETYDVKVLTDKIQFTEYAACAYSFIPMMAKMNKKQPGSSGKV